MTAGQLIGVVIFLAALAYLIRYIVTLLAYTQTLKFRLMNNGEFAGCFGCATIILLGVVGVMIFGLKMAGVL